jgi:hypothetical protein
VHVLAPGAELKLELGTWQVLRSRGFSRPDVSKIVEFLKPLEELLGKAWDEIHKDSEEEGHE